MKKQLKLLISILIIFPLVGSNIMVGTASMESRGSPIGIARPQGLLSGRMNQNFLGFIRNLESANFTDDNVYYIVHNDLGQYTYEVRHSDQRSLSITDLRYDRLENQINLTLNQLRKNESGEVTQEILNYFENLYSEVNSHSSVAIDHSENTDLDVITAVDRKLVTIFFDADRSVIEALETIKENGTVSTQPFTGDEVFTSVFLSLVRDKISGKYEVSNDWTYDDDSEAVLLKDFIARLSQNRWLIRELSVLRKSWDIGLLRNFAAPDQNRNILADKPRILSYGKFLVSQLLIDNLTLRKVPKGLIVDNFVYRYIEHQMLSNIVYNDTNENGYMDIGLRNITIGAQTVAAPTIGDEALYRFDIRTIENRSYTTPTTTDDVLEFGGEYEGISGHLNPIGMNRDDTFFDDSTSLAGKQEIDKISTMFHYSIDETNSVVLKFDYFLGEWTNSGQMDGLSFNQIFSTTVIDSKKTVWQRENNEEISDDIENSTKVSKMRFGASGIQPFGEIRLDDIPYTWDGSDSVNAVGQLLPLNLISFIFGRISSESDQIMGIMKSETRRTYLYSISYPKWGGKSILHDPAFVATGGTGAEDTDTAGGIPGFEFSALVMAFSVLAIPVIINRRKQRFN